MGLGAGINALVTLLMDHSAPKIAARVVLGSAHVTRATADAVIPVAQALVDAATARKRPDFQLALGALLALPQREAFKACERLTHAVSEDFERLGVLARLVAEVASAWGQPKVAQKYLQRQAEADWSRLLERLSIPFTASLLRAAAAAVQAKALSGEAQVDGVCGCVCVPRAFGARAGDGGASGAFTITDRQTKTALDL